MSTIKLYESNSYLEECTAVVTHVEDSTIILNQTIFSPTGGGQSCDRGSINNIDVIDVYEKDDEVYHLLSEPLPLGTTVTCKINWEHRFDNMQRHCGEHILSGMFFREYEGINRGFHMGEDYMTIDISLEENSPFDQLTMEMALNVERLTNQAIWSNLPVTTRKFNNREDASKIPLRKELTLDEGISIVCVGDEKNPSDCVACCGTHPNTSGQVGLLKIYKVEKNKNMFRVYFEAGNRAMEDYNKKHEIISLLGNRYSAGTKDLLNKIKSNEDKSKDTIAKLSLIRNYVINLKAKEISALNDKVIIKEFNILTLEDGLRIGKLVFENFNSLLIFLFPEELTVLVLSDGKIDCGKLVKENMHIYNGKGGGNKISARAIFPKKESLFLFADLIEKHLR